MVGNRICVHPDIRKVGFTGSTDTGRSIMSRYYFYCVKITPTCNSNYILCMHFIIFMSYNCICPRLIVPGPMI